MESCAAPSSPLPPASEPAPSPPAARPPDSSGPAKTKQKKCRQTSSTESPEVRGPSRTGASSLAGPPSCDEWEKTKEQKNNRKNKKHLPLIQPRQKPSKLLTWGDSKCEPLGANSQRCTRTPISWITFHIEVRIMWHRLYYVPFDIMVKNIYYCKHRECFLLLEKNMAFMKSPIHARVKIT
jgi:hypothetical protein